MSYDIRAMTRDDLQRALGWARDEGWNPGLDDAGPFHAADPSGFLMGWLDGEPVSSISVVKYSSQFAFLGLYIVRPRFRGRGLGKAIWDAGFASAGSRTIGLDGVVAQQDNYRRSGFRLAHPSARWSGRLSRLAVADSGVRLLDGSDHAAVRAFDSRHFPAPRDAFLERWLAPSPSRFAAGCFDAAGDLCGYGVIRRCVSDWKIGPLFADGATAAEALIALLSASASAPAIIIDVPQPNRAAVSMARRLGLEPAFETARMYRGPEPALPLNRIFGITSLELG